jgi:hypothetical protein
MSRFVLAAVALGDGTHAAVCRWLGSSRGLTCILSANYKALDGIASLSALLDGSPLLVYAFVSGQNLLAVDGYTIVSPPGPMSRNSVMSC